MKINITKREYRLLLDILNIADWVLHAHHVQKPSETEGHRQLKQRFYSYAKEMGFKNLIEYIPKYEEYFPTAEFEDKSLYMNYIDEFVEDTFWDELIERLVRRDLVREVGEDNFKNMSITERFEKEDPIRQKYEEEFEANGLANLQIAS